MIENVLKKIEQELTKQPHSVLFEKLHIDLVAPQTVHFVDLGYVEDYIATYNAIAQYVNNIGNDSLRSKGFKVEPMTEKTDEVEQILVLIGAKYADGSGSVDTKKMKGGLQFSIPHLQGEIFCILYNTQEMGLYDEFLRRHEEFEAAIDMGLQYHPSMKPYLPNIDADRETLANMGAIKAMQRDGFKLNELVDYFTNHNVIDQEAMNKTFEYFRKELE